MSGPVPAWLRLRVRDADAVRAFYGELLGLRIDDDEAGMRLTPPGGEEPVVYLELDPSAEPAGGPSAGLYHMAFRVPEREDLARMYRQLRLGGVSIRGAADHGVSEALYFSDPEGNGLEVYWDRPEDTWSWEGDEVQMKTDPLDGNGLLATTDGEGELPRGTTLGHLHLKTTDLDGAVDFWTGTVGLDVTTRSWPGAVFLASDRYHHHLGLNEWGGPLQRRGEGTLGLVETAWRVSGRDARETVEDPDGHRVVLVPA